MTDDIETLREFIRKRTSKQTPHGHHALAALERVEKERDALRAKFEMAKEALAPFKRALDRSDEVYGTAHQDDWTVQNTSASQVLTMGDLRYARAVFAELSADASAQQTQTRDEILRAAQHVIYRAEECGALRGPEATDFGSSLAALRAAIAAGETL